ncbi:MAG: bacterioferritin [Rhodobiaceae bacterium]|nr:bacterioferritin [Rhodobiaceae bacterium]
MPTNNKVMKHLTEALAMELTAINQYFLHAHIFNDWGFKKLSAKMREEMAEEQAHADQLMARIIFLDGMPDTGKLNKVYTAKTVVDLFKADLKEELRALEFYSMAAGDCDQARDYVSRDLFVSLLTEEEGHVEWLKEQLNLIERMGEGNYLQTQM